MCGLWNTKLHDVTHGNDVAIASIDFGARGSLPTGGRGLLALTLWVRNLDRDRFRFQRVWQCGRFIGHLYRIHHRGNFDYDCSNIDTSGIFRRFHRDRQKAESPRFKEQFELLRNYRRECEASVLIGLRDCCALPECDFDLHRGVCDGSASGIRDTTGYANAFDRPVDSCLAIGDAQRNAAGLRRNRVALRYKLAIRLRSLDSAARNSARFTFRKKCPPGNIATANDFVVCSAQVSRCQRVILSSPAPP